MRYIIKTRFWDSRIAEVRDKPQKKRLQFLEAPCANNSRIASRDHGQWFFSLNNWIINNDFIPFYGKFQSFHSFAPSYGQNTKFLVARARESFNFCQHNPTFFSKLTFPQSSLQFLPQSFFSILEFSSFSRKKPRIPYPGNLKTFFSHFLHFLCTPRWNLSRTPGRMSAQLTEF